MKVLYLTNNGGRASTTVATKGWFRHLLPRGLQPVLASPILGEFSEWAAGMGVPAYRLSLPFPSKTKPFPFLYSLWQLNRIVRRHRVQLIHCNEQEIYPIGQYLARLCRLPVVVSVHCKVDRGFCEWAMGNRRQPNRVFFISRNSMRVCQEAFQQVVPECKWRLLHNGLEMDQYNPDVSLGQEFRRKWSLGSGPLIGVASALRPGKQLEHLFDAANRLPFPGMRVLVAGGEMPGEESYARNLLEYGRQLLGDRLLHLGWLKDLRGFLNALDLYVNTSKEEAFGISVLEALACGVPVVGYPSVSVQEVVLPGGGEIVEQDRFDQLVEALTRWLGNPLKLSDARIAARQRAEEGFDIRKLSDQLWHEYESLIN